MNYTMKLRFVRNMRLTYDLNDMYYHNMNECKSNGKTTEFKILTENKEQITINKHGENMRI
jgi:hypothetical protein